MVVSYHFIGKPPTAKYSELGSSSFPVEPGGA